MNTTNDHISELHSELKELKLQKRIIEHKIEVTTELVKEHMGEETSLSYYGVPVFEIKDNELILK